MIKNLLSIFLFIGIIAFTACYLPDKKVANEFEKNSLIILKTDMDFSAMNADKGMKAAFLEFIDSDGVLLRPNVLPIAGADAIDYLIARKDTGYKMTWKPKGANVAASGDLGYTYGVYEIHASAIDTVLYGTYVSIWKKQQNGKWKFILNSGNEGIGENN